MGVSIGNAVVFSRGTRYDKTGETCPNCEKANLNIDKMSMNGIIYKCFNCNYTETRKENTK